MRSARSFAVLMLALAALSGCVPSPSANENVLPTYTLLSTFYTPINGVYSFLWKHSTSKDTTFSIEQFDHTGPNLYPSIYSTATFFRCSDTATKVQTQKESVILDSIVIEYLRVGDSINAIARLHGLLKVGESWIASSKLNTSNGSAVTMSALVDDYYSLTQVSGKQYSDVYHITYKISNVLSGLQPIEAEYQKGATMVVYYAKSIGPIYKITRDAFGNILSSDELIETRSL